VAGWDVYQETSDVTSGNSLEVLTDDLNVPAGDERHPRFYNMPSLFDKLVERRFRLALLLLRLD